MIKKHHFNAVIIASDRGGAYVKVPFDVEKELGSKRPKVKVLFEKKQEYRGTLVRMKTPFHILIVKKDIRAALKKQTGDEIAVELMLDTEPRTVEIPPELKAAFLKSKKASSFFAGLSYTCQKEYANYIIEAKRKATKERRTLKVLQMLQEGKKSIH
jgi:uncharacterized protein YdeI (YjbR/CyaY-like superfamily)